LNDEVAGTSARRVRDDGRLFLAINKGKCLYVDCRFAAHVECVDHPHAGMLSRSNFDAVVACKWPRQPVLARNVEAPH
jgi:hypothetical protein